MIAVANAPCSWGILEFDSSAVRTPARQVLAEMSAAGYAGTEFGDWGFLPTDPVALAALVAEYRLALVGAFVPVALANASAEASAIAQAVRIATLLERAGGRESFIVLSDDNATVAARTARAGRIALSDGLAPAEWTDFAARAERIAIAVRDAAGLPTAFHHHCAGYVETPAELDALMSRTDPSLLGLCLDTGHFTYGGGNPVDAVRTYGSRVWHVHVKDCDPRVLDGVRREQWGYHEALARGVFCELGTGVVDLPAVVAELERQAYDGWIVVEQDVVAGSGTPFASARRNRDVLRRLGI